MSNRNLSSPQFKTLYRGVAVSQHWKNQGATEDAQGNPVKPINVLPNPVNEQGGIHFNTGLGIHWTDRRNIASSFAEGQTKLDIENPDRPFAVHLPDKKPVAAIIHAQVPKEHIYDENNNSVHPEGIKKHSKVMYPITSGEAHIFGRNEEEWKGEREHTVFPDTSVNITKVEKFRKVGSGIKKREIKYTPPRERKA